MVEFCHISDVTYGSLLSLTAANTLPIHQDVNAEIARLLPQATQVTIPDASHGMWAEQPDACGKVVLEFLQGQAARV